MSIKGSVARLIALCFCSLLFSFGFGVSSADAQPKFNGKMLYQNAVREMANQHFALQDKSTRERWLKVWQTKFVATGQLSTRYGTDRAIREMICSMNYRFDRFLSPADVRQQNQQVETSQFIGVGMTYETLDSRTGLGTSDCIPVLGAVNQLTITAEPLEGTPARKAGLKRGDVIVAVNSQTTAGRTTSEVMDTIGDGRIGTVVKLTVQRNGVEVELPITLGVVKTDAVVYKDLDSETAYIKLTDFEPANVEALMRAALARASKKKVLIFDLRDNGGGRSEAGLSVPAYLLERGTLQVSRDRKSDDILVTTEELTDTHFIRKTHFASNPGNVISYVKRKRKLDLARVLNPQVKVFVLINESTASSAELTAGALKANNRVVLIGKKTFGKGVEQTYTELPYGRQIAITTGEFDPGGVKNNHVGILPDIEVDQAPGQDTQYERALLEANLYLATLK